MAVREPLTGANILPGEAPAPWSTHYETYWLVVRLPKPLPDGIYDSLEASHPACSTEGFAGGIGMIQIVRYSDPPVGSYDELIIIPGKFRVAGGSQKAQARMRITRIYVSQRETTYNGISIAVDRATYPDR